MANAIAQPQAFIDGKNFEKFILNLINSADNGYFAKVLAKTGIDLKTFKAYDQIQIWVGNKWIIADNVFYKEIGFQTGKFKVVVNECKLGSGTALSTNQQAFYDAIIGGQRTFKIRSV